MPDPSFSNGQRESPTMQKRWQTCQVSFADQNVTQSLYRRRIGDSERTVVVHSSSL